MKPHCVHYILYRDIGYGTLCSTALSIGVVSARGSIDALINEELIQMTDKEGFVVERKAKKPLKNAQFCLPC